MLFVFLFICEICVICGCFLKLCNFPGISNVNSRKSSVALCREAKERLSKDNTNRSSPNDSTPICRRASAFRPTCPVCRIRPAAWSTTARARSERSDRAHQRRGHESLTGDADSELSGGRNRPASDRIAEREARQRMDARHARKVG